MSLKDRFVDGVSSLFDKLGDEGELSGVAPQALEREFAIRSEMAKKAPKPSDNPRARVARAAPNYPCHT